MPEELTLRERMNEVTGKVFLLRNFKQGGADLAAYNQQTIIAEALITLVEQGEAQVAQTGSKKNKK
tara:strand:+ start:185 stop:382 length:198 start_codon:yes stop_codon:yes gene_type:complete